MSRDKIYIAITGILIIVFIFMYISFSDDKSWESDDFNARVEEHEQKVIQQSEENKSAKQRSDDILAVTPGIACWGDGFTYGTYGEGRSYPTMLEELLSKNDYPYPIANMGVYAEDSRTVLGRAGALPFVIAKNFTIEGTENDLIKIDITSEDGSEVNPCIQEFNPGFNPCVVNGVECTIYGETTAENVNKANAYYLSRQDKSTKTVDVKAGTVVETFGSTQYKNYINILQIGDSGGYSSDSELVEQNEKFVESLNGSDKYLILGRLSGSDEDNEAYDEAMENSFGEHYLNIREALTENEIEGVEYTDQDKDNMEIGYVPDCLLTENYLNKHGYDALGTIVYEKLEDLGIIEK